MAPTKPTKRVLIRVQEETNDGSGDRVTDEEVFRGPITDKVSVATIARGVGAAL